MSTLTSIYINTVMINDLVPSDYTRDCYCVLVGAIVRHLQKQNCKFSKYNKEII